MGTFFQVQGLGHLRAYPSQAYAARWRVASDQAPERNVEACDSSLSKSGGW
jgi:hypothetical protein